MDNLTLIESFTEFKDDKLIDRVTLMAILEDVFRSSLRRKFGDDENFDIIINATSLGLKDGKDFHFNFSNTKDNLIYIDTIYNPLETKTLKYLKEKDIKVFNGLGMFIYQGQKAFYLWNKINPEIDEKLIELLVSNLK